MNLKEVRYKEIYTTNYPKVLRLCMGYTGGNEASSKDLAQEVFIKIWQHLEAFRNESSIDTWVYRISVNTCLASIRKEKKRKTTVRLQDIQLTDVEDITVDKELMFSQLYRCINTLAPMNKAIILLELEGVPQQEISEIMGIKHEAIRTRVHRIKNQLIKCVNHE